MNFDIATVKEHATGQWSRIITTLCDIDPQKLNGRNHPCPKCGEGKDRFFAYKDFDQKGGVHCRKCGKKCSDGIATVAWLLGVDFKESLKRVAKESGAPPSKAGSKRRRSRSQSVRKSQQKKASSKFKSQKSGKGTAGEGVSPIEFCSWSKRSEPKLMRSGNFDSIDAIKTAGGQMGVHRGQRIVAMPIHRNNELVGHTVYPVAETRIKHPSSENGLKKMTVLLE